jgi:hypothetical protein
MLLLMCRKQRMNCNKELAQNDGIKITGWILWIALC